MAEAGDCRNDATKMHSVGSGIESRRKGHTCRMASGEKKEGKKKEERRSPNIFGRNKHRKKMLNFLDFIGKICKIRLRMIAALCEEWQSFLFQKNSHALAYIKKKL